MSDLGLRKDDMPFVEEFVKFVGKIFPSLLQVVSFVIMAVIVNTRGEGSFSNVDLGILPFHLTLVGGGIALVHIAILFLFVYKCDPAYTRSMSPEKIVAVLIHKNMIPAEIDVSCSRKAKYILMEAITKANGNFKFKQDVKEEVEVNLEENPDSFNLSGILNIEGKFLC